MWMPVSLLARVARSLQRDCNGREEGGRRRSPVLAVLDAGQVPRAVLVGHRTQAFRCLMTAARHR
jgi:hypothetical protein